MGKEYGPAPLKRYESVERNLRIDHHMKGEPFQVFWKKKGVVSMQTLPTGISLEEARLRRDEIISVIDATRKPPVMGGSDLLPLWQEFLMERVAAKELDAVTASIYVGQVTKALEFMAVTRGFTTILGEESN